MLPMNLVFVRHGHSEGNAANHRSEDGDHSLFTPEHMSRHSSSWRLTDKGLAQAKAAGRWLRENGLGNFHRYLTSEYLRCLETAANLELPDAKWLMDFHLRERDYGLMDVVNDAERKTRFAEHVREFDKHRFYATLPSGETMARLAARLNATVFADLHEYGVSNPNTNVIVVTHGGVMRAVRVMLERDTGYAYHERESVGSERVQNCEILHYTRQNPADATEILPHMGWVRTVRPTGKTPTVGEWRKIDFRHYSNDGLLAFIARQPRLINNE